MVGIIGAVHEACLKHECSTQPTPSQYCVVEGHLYKGMVNIEESRVTTNKALPRLITEAAMDTGCIVGDVPQGKP